MADGESFTLNGVPVPAPAGASPAAAAPSPSANRLAYGGSAEDINRAGRAARAASPPAQPEASAKAPTGDGEPPPAQPGQSQPQRYKFGDLDLSEQDIRDGATLRAQQNSVRAANPSPDSYKLDLSSDFEAPPGVEFALDESSDEARHAREFAHKHSLGQQAFSELLSLYAGTKVGEQKMLADARKAEIDKLGPAGTARVDAITTWMDAKGYGAMKPMLVTDGIVRAFKSLMLKMTGGSSFSQAHRDTPDPSGKIPNYANMSFEQRREAQDAATHQRGGRR